MTIDWWTLALQAVNFLVLVWLLWRFLYRPVKEVIEKRKQLAEQAFADADKRKGEAEAARRQFEEGRAALTKERQDMLTKAHLELEAERRKALEEARQEADALLEAARESLAKERVATLRQVREEVVALAVELASGLLKTADPRAFSAGCLEQFERQLKEMPADEREHLKQDIEPDSASLTVVTAAPLSARERDRWTDRLNACLGQRDKIGFATDRGILGGAELRFPHAVLKLTWTDQLRQAEKILRRDETAS